MDRDKPLVGKLDDGSTIIIMTMRSLIGGLFRRSALILAVYLLYAAGQIYFHWYAGTQATAQAHAGRERRGK